jgi:hypothetical protein
MTRRVLSDAEVAALEAGDDRAPTSIVAGAVEASARAKASRKRRYGTPAAQRRQLEKAVAEADANRVSGDWSAAKPAHLVGLYALAHRRIYGVEPLELEADFLGAVSAAKKLVADAFEGDVVRALDFVGWVWVGEEKRERERRSKDEKKNDYRITWRSQFVSRSHLTNYQIAVARERARKR